MVQNPMPAVRTPDFQQAQHAFTAHLRDPQRVPAPNDVEDRRMAIYRELLHNNVSGFLAANFPVLKAILPEAQWDNMVGDFFARHHSESPYFSKIPEEFIDYLQTEREQHPAHVEDPPFLLELAHYEWVELALSIDEAETVDPAAFPDQPLDAVFRLSALAWPLVYLYPVHQLSPDNQPQTPPEQPTYLVVHRAPDDQVKFIETNPVTHRLLELMAENESVTLQTQCLQIAAEINHPQPNVVVQGGLSIVRDLHQRGIVSTLI